MKKRKGERERPCPRCETPVRYLKGKSDTCVRFGRPREGWHWVNAADNSHHRCADFVQTSEDRWASDWEAAMQRERHLSA